MPRTHDEEDPKSYDDEPVRPAIDDRFDPEDPKAEGDGGSRGVSSRVSRDPASDIDDEELAEEDILEMSDIDDDDDEYGDGPDA